jgi:hypothetical protein
MLTQVGYVPNLGECSVSHKERKSGSLFHVLYSSSVVDPNNRRSLQSSKENIQNFKKLNLITFFFSLFLCVIFALLDLDPQHWFIRNVNFYKMTCLHTESSVLKTIRSVSPVPVYCMLMRSAWSAQTVLKSCSTTSWFSILIQCETMTMNPSM